MTLNNRDKFLAATLATFFTIISCSQLVTNERIDAGGSATVQITPTPQGYEVGYEVGMYHPLTDTLNTISLITLNSYVGAGFNANNLNCGFVTSSQGTWDSTEINYQCWQVDSDTCFEDMDCWDCESMGNKICSREYWLTKLFGDAYDSRYEIEIDYQVRYEMEGE